MQRKYQFPAAGRCTMECILAAERERTRSLSENA